MSPSRFQMMNLVKCEVCSHVYNIETANVYEADFYFSYLLIW